jgi:hypothetical protein
MEDKLRRYTELPYVIDYLCTKKLALLNPASWDDRNDSFYIEKYASHYKFKSVYALCFARCAETYHHWRVFSNGSSGACIQFFPEKFDAEIRKANRVRAELVKYKTINDLHQTHPTHNDLPFLKRYAFKDEGEYRLFYAKKRKGPPIHRVSMPLSALDKIILSPWLPDAVIDHVKETLKSIPGCSNVKIDRSDLIENGNWKSFAKGSD